MNGIANLRVLIESVLKAGDAYKHLVSSQTSGQGASNASGASRQVTPAYPGTESSDPLFAIAQEFNNASKTKGALKVIRNLSAVALSVRVLMQVGSLIQASTSLSSQLINVYGWCIGQLLIDTGQSRRSHPTTARGFATSVYFPKRRTYRRNV